MPRTTMSEMFEASRVASGHEFPQTVKNPQPDCVRLANLSSWAVRGIAPLIDEQSNKNKARLEPKPG